MPTIRHRRVRSRLATPPKTGAKAKALSSDAKPVRSTNENRKCELDSVKRIMIVDDHPLFRKGLQQLIDSHEGLAVCGEAARAGEAMEGVRKIKPDLVIVDLSLPGTHGLELIKNIRAEFPRLSVLVLSMYDESLYALRALRAGAQGYIMKEEALENVIHAIHEVFAGRPYLSAAMSSDVIAKFAHGFEKPQKDTIEQLSDRELEVLELIGKGHDVREIATSLHLSPKTVETHRAHIKEKLRLRNARQVARFAVQWVSGQAT
jgi:DNA-binding NarL/FixJ family response regulator